MYQSKDEMRGKKRQEKVERKRNGSSIQVRTKDRAEREDRARRCAVKG